MFRRLRKLHLSLAGKCQLLYGAAVVLIITAALVVLWLRMEQLTDQPNTSAGRLLTEYALATHVRQMMARQQPPTTATSEPVGALLPPATVPTGDPGPELLSLRMVLLKGGPGAATLDRVGAKAMDYLAAHPEAECYTKWEEVKTGQPIVHYSQFVYAESDCMRCHAGDLPARIEPHPKPSATPAAGAATRPAPLLGMVNIDMRSQVPTRQIILNRVVIFTAGLLSGVVALLVFYFITTRLILQPVRVLQRTAEKVSKGDLSIRSSINTGDEFQQLSETFNTMLGNLKESEDQLRAINKSLDLKLEQMAESNLALYESNRLKSEFLANVSHELRTPLTSILGFAELLRDAAAEPKNARYLQNILQSGRHLLDLINDLLDLAKIEAGRMEVRSEPISLHDLFEGLTSILKPLAERKDLVVDSDVSRDVPIIHTDPAKLQQVLYNFLSNAIKFSPPGGKIELRGSRQGEQWVRVSVTDHGPGIAPEQQAVIFEKFRQIDGSVTREHGGTGLGLAISKELVFLLNGTIGVESRPAEGATFWIVLPMKIQGGAQAVRREMATV